MLDNHSPSLHRAHLATVTPTRGLSVTDLHRYVYCNR